MDAEFKFIIDNVIFPPQLPQSAEPKELEAEDVLLSLVIGVTQLLVEKCSSMGYKNGWDSVLSMLKNLQNIRRNGNTLEESLLKAFEDMIKDSSKINAVTWIVCYIRAQNCGWTMQI
ncbi:hypothetical protein FQN57_002107 [Myotisia sp. PD_48]|nr:hypothetical protein FQN57_002107 [Myotisia sp. PD_48]